MYTEWLSDETGQGYRLLSEAEWEYVARAGTRTARYWGNRETQQCSHANGADQTAKRYESSWTVAACDDGQYWTAPLGSYQANEFGLHDMLGNAWEWVQDCFNENYFGALEDGRTWERGDCSQRVLRGGSWVYEPTGLRSASRLSANAEDRDVNYGFRIAWNLD